MFHVKRSITIRRPLAEVYAYWRDLENLSQFITHLQAVSSTGDGKSHWTLKMPGAEPCEWDAAIVEERPNERIAWRSVGGSSVDSEGSVRVRQAPADRGTEVEVELRCSAPDSRLAKLFGPDPATRIRDGLRRFKQVIETGEVVVSDGSPYGAGQGATKQRAAQPGALTEVVPS